MCICKLSLAIAAKYQPRVTGFSTINFASPRAQRKTDSYIRLVFRLLYNDPGANSFAEAGLPDTFQIF